MSCILQFGFKVHSHVMLESVLTENLGGVLGGT
jgi:hypothetical protein